MVLVASAPAPASEALTSPPETATPAAAVIARILVWSLAHTVIPPDVDVRLVAFETDASTMLEISLRASATPIEMAAPTTPAPIDNAAAPAKALMVDVSLAVIRIVDAVMPVRVTPGATSPLIAAWTKVLIRLSALTPEPAAPMPTTPPPSPTAAENTMALIWAASIAVMRSAPGADIVVWATVARTSDGAEVPSIRQPM
jgi:hypothetical protein